MKAYNIILMIMIIDRKFLFKLFIPPHTHPTWNENRIEKEENSYNSPTKELILSFFNNVGKPHSYIRCLSMIEIWLP